MFAYHLWTTQVWIGYYLMCINFGMSIGAAITGRWSSVIHVLIAILLLYVVRGQDTTLRLEMKARGEEE